MRPLPSLAKVVIAQLAGRVVLTAATAIAVFAFGSSKAIAAELGLSVKTVEHYRTSLLAKFGASNLVGLIRAALREGLLDLDEDG